MPVCWSNAQNMARKKRTLFLHKKNPLHWIQLHQNPQLNSHFKERGFLKFSQKLENNLKKFPPSPHPSHFYEEANPPFPTSPGTDPDPCPLHKREEVGRYRREKPLRLFREVIHPEKQVLSCQSRTTLGVGWCWYCSRILSKVETIQPVAMQLCEVHPCGAFQCHESFLMLNQSQNKYNRVGWEIILCNVQLTKRNYPKGYSKPASEAVLDKTCAFLKC